MHILADKDIPAVERSFSAFGPVRLFDGRRLRKSDIGEAEVLLVRAITRVDEALLEDSPIKFVGSVTAGVDHVDIDYLNDASIEFAFAAGTNSRAVAEYVVNCIYLYAHMRKRSPRDLTVGIIGYGNVGQVLGGILDRLGITYLVNDPPLASASATVRQVSLQCVLQSDVVSLHVPLTRNGDHPTKDLINASNAAILHPEALLINTSRGGVVNEAALCARFSNDTAIYAAIDCWIGEPNIDLDLLTRAWIATPHVAGHSLKARLAATRLLCAALNLFLKRDTVSSDATADGDGERLYLDSGKYGVVDVLSKAHPLVDQTQSLRQMLSLPKAHRGPYFDDLRRQYGFRREFSNINVESETLASDTVDELRTLGFRCEDPSEKKIES